MLRPPKNGVNDIVGREQGAGYSLRSFIEIAAVAVGEFARIPPHSRDAKSGILANSAMVRTNQIEIAVVAVAQFARIPPPPRDAKSGVFANSATARASHVVHRRRRCWRTVTARDILVEKAAFPGDPSCFARSWPPFVVWRCSPAFSARSTFKLPSRRSTLPDW